MHGGGVDCPDSANIAEGLYIVNRIKYSLITSDKRVKILLSGVISMNITEAVKRRFEELCNQRNINFCKLATMAGVPYTTVKSIFYGQSKNPGIATIKKLCDGLNITITEFFDTEYFKELEQEIK